MKLVGIEDLAASEKVKAKARTFAAGTLHFDKATSQQQVALANAMLVAVYTAECDLVGLMWGVDAQELMQQQPGRLWYVAS